MNQIIPTAGITGGLLTKTGLFKPFQAAGFAMLTLGFGLCVLLTPQTRTVIWVVFISIQATGLGAVLPCTLPAVLASLDESDVALATGMYSFLRSFGYIWGVTISAVIFNASFDRYSFEIHDVALRDRLSQGKAYQFVSGELVRNLSPRSQEQVLNVYTKSLRIGWEAAAVISFVAMLTVFISKHVTLRSKLETDYGLEKKSRDDLIHC
jgi:MFS family permease